MLLISVKWAPFANGRANLDVAEDSRSEGAFDGP